MDKENSESIAVVSPSFFGMVSKFLKVEEAFEMFKSKRFSK
jgi:hypothetical protein